MNREIYTEKRERGNIDGTNVHCRIQTLADSDEPGNFAQVREVVLLPAHVGLLSILRGEMRAHLWVLQEIHISSIIPFLCVG